MKKRKRPNHGEQGELDPEHDLESLLATRSAALDSCTLILLDKAGVLDKVADAFIFSSVGGVRDETGYSGMAVRFVTGAFPGTTDSAVYGLAKSKGMKLASDDRKLLIRASLEGTVCMDSLDLVIAAFADGKLDEEETLRAMETLEVLRPYPEDRLLEADKLLAAARKIR